MANKKVKINRAPVLTLWATVVAERLGYDEETALTLGKAVAGLNARPATTGHMTAGSSPAAATQGSWSSAPSVTDSTPARS